jgi:hypothetical protein
MQCLGKYFGLFGLSQQVPVVGHKAVGKKVDRIRRQHFEERLFE